VYPLKIFVVFLHELCHGLAAVATGGQIERISSAPRREDCASPAGKPVPQLNAGYLGSLALGPRSSWSGPPRGMTGQLWR
jgi:hypothetical protein